MVHCECTLKLRTSGVVHCEPILKLRMSGGTVCILYLGQVADKLGEWTDCGHSPNAGPQRCTVIASTGTSNLPLEVRPSLYGLNE